MSDLISRQAAIDAVEKDRVSTNPNDFASNEKFIPFMDNPEIASFGRWQWANGFNTAIVDAKIAIKNVPSVQPEVKVESNTYDEEERIFPCTVQILRNSITGEESVGWWQGEEPPKAEVEE